ncbi:nucleotidyltransferase family protein [Hominifimenecus sp. rT4P-3]|uniref:nucleotidyltransferase family protein n=1 Tax=Hominifimenecus sp. rT4P-3 TaxID=3242979 RepID=UPI003DA29AB8
MEKPCLVIMAAGMGSRYGGLKQIDPVDPQGHIIMDFSVFDAREAGFEKVVFIIKEEFQQEFQRVIGDRVAKTMEVAYVFQKLTDLPDGFRVPEGRVKPWGTAHALLSCRKEVKGPFAAINADDYYGKQAFRDLYRYLTEYEDDLTYHFAMSGYQLKNTLTENGHVARGVCAINEQGYLTDIVEHTHIAWKDGVPAYTEDDGASWAKLPPDTTVSMNMWGFSQNFLRETEERFAAFLEQGIKENPLKCEYYIPTVVHELLEEQKATVQVLKTADKWYGVTYKEDKPLVERAIADMKKAGLYPENF